MIISRPWLWLPSKAAHDWAPYILPIISPLCAASSKKWRSYQWRGLQFDNPMGIAGGVDKTGRTIKAWSRLGAGFVEVGTVTPLGQGPNPGKIMDRDIAASALWNKMGFPNPGAEALVARLQKLGKLDVPLFVNIGKNRETSNQDAHLDYSKCLEMLKPYADVFVVNLSSPNTKGLRDLLDSAHLLEFLNKLKASVEEFDISQPIVLKLSPDMEASALESVLKTSCEYVDGWILTNTTKQRYQGSRFNPTEGGVSGEPLSDLSLEALKIAAPFKKQNPEKLLVSVGGISSPEEIEQRMKLGADLVQFYSALVFQGPLFFKKALNSLSSAAH